MLYVIKTLIVLLYFIVLCHCTVRDEQIVKEDMSYWIRAGRTHLLEILSHRNIERQAKNVIVFIGDGMGLSTVTAGRIFKGQSKGFSGEEYKLTFENFPNTGLSKTYNVDRQVPDSAGTATALFTGVKSRYRMLGFDAKSQYNVCDKEVNENSKLTTVVTWAQESGLDTGFVTTTRVTHATPGSLYAHINNRDWESDTKTPKQYLNCTKDIARQLIEDTPGRDFKVIMGGGSGVLGSTYSTDHNASWNRTDGRNLTKTWQENNPDGKFVSTVQDLMSIDIGNTSKILGIFAPSHFPYQADRNDTTPSLANMTMQAIRLLRKNKKGFFLMVEGGKIDIAHHQNYAKLALRELSDFDDAVSVALQQVKLEETLIIVTADHSHAFTLNGYPERGNDILGYANQTANLEPYETLSYANGPGFYDHRENGNASVFDTWKRVETDPTRNSTYYRHFAARPLVDETHGGEDVSVYAIGPYAHLLRGTFEQNYIAHVVAFAACFKDWLSHCDGYFYSNFNTYYNSSSHPSSSYTLIMLCTLFWISRRLF